ncbi:MAG: serine/threonine-protein kinase, partial [Bacteroidota bacterium]
MPRPDSSRIEEIFNDALDVPAEERAAFLDTVCGSDTELRQEVDSLLSAYAEGSDYLDDFADAVIQLSAEQGLPALNARVGPYELVEAVGQGGMGVVYRARRIDGQFDREVAVKLLRNDLFGPAARGRFEAERVILARLTHPNIARLLDAGVAEVAGQAPYLVMEWAPGEPITGYVRRHNLSVEERVRLVVTVCSAVQHAHGRLVIHRDLKPSNILVSDGEDGRPDVRLLDFGIAKLLDGSADGLPLTQTGDRWMTPEYASPEQITGGDVTTRTDVYQIGVLLYELLTGQTPFQTEGDRRHELARMVVETEPVKPSDRLTQPSAQRTAGTQRFRRQIEGDLDMIVMKALRKEPDRRYVSVDALAEDLRLHLAGFPINARPDSVQYRVRKFVQRNRGGVLAAVVLALLVMTYAVTVTVQREQIEQERNRAEAAVGFLSSVFQVSDPNIAQGDTLTADEILLRGAERAATIEDTELRGDMQRLLGQLLFQLGRSTASVALLDGAVDSYEEAGDQAAALAGSFNDLARAHYLAEIGGRDTAVVVAKQAMEIADRSGSRLERARALANLGRALALQRDEEQRDEIVSMLEESVRIHRSIDSESEELADAMEYLGNYYYSIREYDNVIALSHDLLPLRQALEPKAGIGTARVMQMRELALSQSEGPTAESDSLIDGALAIYTRIL